MTDVTTTISVTGNDVDGYQGAIVVAGTTVASCADTHTTSAEASAHVEQAWTENPSTPGVDYSP